MISVLTSVTTSAAVVAAVDIAVDVVMISVVVKMTCCDPICWRWAVVRVREPRRDSNALLTVKEAALALSTHTDQTCNHVLMCTYMYARHMCTCDTYVCSMLLLIVVAHFGMCRSAAC